MTTIFRYTVILVYDSSYNLFISIIKDTRTIFFKYKILLKFVSRAMK